MDKAAHLASWQVERVQTKISQGVGNPGMPRAGLPNQPAGHPKLPLLYQRLTTLVCMPGWPQDISYWAAVHLADSIPSLMQSTATGLPYYDRCSS